MNQELQELEELYHQVNDSKQKIDILERAINIAEKEGLDYNAYELRGELVDQATFNGYPLKAIVAFSQRQKYNDEHPEVGEKWSLLWEYKWIIGVAPKFHQVSYEQINHLLEDFKKRLLEYGDNLSAYYTMKYLVASRMKDMEGMKKYHQLRHSIQEGMLNNCSTCVLDDKVEFHALIEGFEKATETAKPITEDKESCGSVPQNTYYTLIKAALKEKRIEEAEAIRVKAERKIAKDEKFYGDFGFHLIVLVAQEKYSRAFELFKKYYQNTYNLANSGICHFDFHLGSTILFEHLTKQGKEVILPFALENCSEKGESVPAERVRNHLLTKTKEWANRFDKRNQNNSFENEMNLFFKLYNPAN